MAISSLTMQVGVYLSMYSYTVAVKNNWYLQCNTLYQLFLTAIVCIYFYVNVGTIYVCSFYNIGTVGGQIKLGHLKFNLCKSDH
jgi:hypothetical protein